MEKSKEEILGLQIIGKAESFFDCLRVIRERLLQERTHAALDSLLQLMSTRESLIKKVEELTEMLVDATIRPKHLRDWLSREDTRLDELYGSFTAEDREYHGNKVLEYQNKGYDGNTSDLLALYDLVHIGRETDYDRWDCRVERERGEVDSV